MDERTTARRTSDPATQASLGRGEAPSAPGEPWAVSLGPPPAPAARLIERFVSNAQRLIVIDERLAGPGAHLGVPSENVLSTPPGAGSALRLVLALLRLSRAAPLATVVVSWRSAKVRAAPEPDDRTLGAALELAAARPDAGFLIGRRSAGLVEPRFARLGPRLSDGSFLVGALEVRPSPRRTRRLLEEGAVAARPLLVARLGALRGLVEGALGVPLDLLWEEGDAYPARSWLARGLYLATPPADLERDVLAASTERLRLVLEEPATGLSPSPA